MKKAFNGLWVLLTLLSVRGFAGVDKVYSPYVEPGETEVELRGIHGTSGDSHELKFGVGYGITSHWFMEGYLNGEKEDGNFKIEEYEFENKFQFGEQGEYWADTGLLVELEKKRQDDVWELKAGPLIRKRFGRVEATTNLLLEQKFGSDNTEDKVETLGSLQVKYRLDKTFEPAVEYYADDETSAIGPVLLGNNRVFNSELKWELGVLFALNAQTEDTTLRWQMEWEF